MPTALCFLLNQTQRAAYSHDLIPCARVVLHLWDQISKKSDFGIQSHKAELIPAETQVLTSAATQVGRGMIPSPSMQICGSEL